MTLPRSSRRSTATWAINVATLAVLVSSVWMSAQQRPAAATQFGATPAAAEPAKHPPVAAGITATTRSTSGNTGALALGNATLDADGLQRVAYSATVKR
jgi:hypothetical protein